MNPQNPHSITSSENPNKRQSKKTYTQWRFDRSWSDFLHKNLNFLVSGWTGTYIFLYLRRFLFQEIKKNNNSSASVLNSYNFTILVRCILFEKRLCFKSKYIHFVCSYVVYVAFPSCLRRGDQFVVFSLYFSDHEVHDDMLKMKALLYQHRFS